MPLEQTFYEVVLEALPAADAAQLTVIYHTTETLMVQRGLKQAPLHQREVPVPTSIPANPNPATPAGTPRPNASLGPWAPLVATSPGDIAYRRDARAAVGVLSKGDPLRIGINIRPMYLQNHTGKYLGTGMQHGDKILRIGVVLDHGVRKYQPGATIWVPVNCLEVMRP